MTSFDVFETTLRGSWVTKVIIEFAGGTVVILFLLQTGAHAATLSLPASS